MGKQKKQRKNKNNPNKKFSKPEGNANTSLQDNSKHKTIIQKLRSSKPELIETTLSALCMTIFDPSSLQSSKNKTITSDLLHTIIDKIVDNKSSTGVISNALGCILNIVSFDTNGDVIKLLLNGNLDILRVLLVRIHGSLSLINDSMDIESTEKKPKAKVNHQYEILKLSYKCLISLLETLPSTIVETKLTNSEYYKPHTLLQILHDSTTVPNTLTQYVTQLVHTAIDDNISFSIDVTQDSAILDYLANIVNDDSHDDIARLHACGCIVTLRTNILHLPKYHDIIDKLTHHCDTISQTLLNSLQSFDITRISEFTQSLSVITDKLAQEKEDEILENNTIKAIESKKESARSIARRLKDVKPEKEDSMDVDNDTSMILQEQYDEIHDAYKSYVSKYELTLELCTNLCCTNEGNNDAMEDNIDDTLIKKLVAVGIPNAIMSFFTELGQVKQDELFNTLLQTCTSNINNLYQNPYYTEHCIKSNYNAIWNDWISMAQKYKDNLIMIECIINIVCTVVRTFQQCDVIPQQMHCLDLFISIYHNASNEKVKIDLLMILSMFLNTSHELNKILQSIIIPTLSQNQISKLSLEIMNVCMDIDEQLSNSENIILDCMKYYWKEYKRNSNLFSEKCACVDEEMEYYGEIMENVERFLDYKGVR